MISGPNSVGQVCDPPGSGSPWAGCCSRRVTVSNHHHFLVEETNALLDIPGSHIEVSALPDAPAGMEIDRVDVIIRLRRK